MILLDTNIFIYLANGSLPAKVIGKDEVYFASISKIEALGFKKITVLEQSYLKLLFDECHQIDLDENILDQAITLRLQKSMTLGDSIIAASAIEEKCELWTANTDDFQDVDGLKVFNPLNTK